MSKKEKPYICEVLGVDIGQTFSVNKNLYFCVNADGYVFEYYHNVLLPVDSMLLCDIINGKYEVDIFDEY